MSVFRLYNKTSKISSEDLEELAKAMLRQLKVVGQRYVEEEVGDEDPESLRVKIYAEAFANRSIDQKIGEKGSRMTHLQESLLAALMIIPSRYQ